MRGNRKKILLSVFIVFIALGIVLLIAFTTGPFYYHFGERRTVDIYSYLQLFATAYLAFSTCRMLEAKSSLGWKKNPAARPFFISAIGFFYLGLDDLLSIHENLDKLIHIVWRIKETALTDHIDDIILLLYGVIAIFFIKDFIREFRKHPFMIGLIVGGFFFFFTMSCLDFLTNNKETFTYFFRGLVGGDIGHKKDLFKMVEDSSKVLGGACFLSAFLAAHIDIKTKDK